MNGIWKKTNKIYDLCDGDYTYLKSYWNERFRLEILRLLKQKEVISKDFSDLENIHKNVLDKNNKLDSNANTAVLASSLTEVAGVYPDKAVALKALEEFKKNDMRGIYHYEVEKAKETRETTNDAMTITNQVYATNQRVPTDLSKSEFMSPIAALLLQEKQVVGNFLEDRHGDYV